MEYYSIPEGATVAPARPLSPVPFFPVLDPGLREENSSQPLRDDETEAKSPWIQDAVLAGPAGGGSDQALRAPGKRISPIRPPAPPSSHRQIAGRRSPDRREGLDMEKTCSGGVS
jgi:hypothetical protein